LTLVVKIDLTELLRKVGNEADVKLTEEISYPEDNLILTKPAAINLHLVNTGTSVLVKGRVETEVGLICSRCLKNFNLPISINIQEEFSKDPQACKEGGEAELKEEDFVYPIEKDNSLDFTEVLRQNLLLALPIKTLCRPECKGE
jgi:uncharacterized protein